jgi:hypothetical protein
MHIHLQTLHVSCLSPWEPKRSPTRNYIRSPSRFVLAMAGQSGQVIYYSKPFCIESKFYIPTLFYNKSHSIPAKLSQLIPISSLLAITMTGLSPSEHIADPHGWHPAPAHRKRRVYRSACSDPPGQCQLRSIRTRLFGLSCSHHLLKSSGKRVYQGTEPISKTHAKNGAQAFAQRNGHRQGPFGSSTIWPAPCGIRCSQSSQTPSRRDRSQSPAPAW